MRPKIRKVKSVLRDPDALVPPAFWHCPDYAETLGPEVCEINTLFGYVPNPEQSLLHDGSFGMDRTGRLTSFEVGVVAARQNLKTGFLIQRAIGKALLLRRPLQIWTAHKESATDQAFAEFQKMRASSDEFAKRVKRMPEGKGSKAVEFVNGCTIVFRPRTGKAGQSMSADDVDLDEYFAVEPKHESSLIPTLSTRPNAQIGMVSSAPHAASDMQRQLMRRGRLAALGMAEEPRLLYAEWSPMEYAGETLSGEPRFAPKPCVSEKCDHEPGTPGCIVDDREVIKRSNPSVARKKAPSITWAFIEAERRKAQGEGLEEYLKERMSIGVEAIDAAALTVFGPASVWKRGEVEFVADGTGAIGVAMSADRQWIGLTGSSVIEVEDPNDPEAEPSDKVLIAPILHTTELDEAVAALKEWQDKHDCIVTLDENGPAAALLERFEDEDIAVETMTLREIATASANVYDRVTAQGEPTLVHLANTVLDQHVQAASWRWVNDNRIIGRRDGQESIDSTLLEAGILAAHQAERAGTFNVY